MLHQSEWGEDGVRPSDGIEPALALTWKSLMAHGFWFKPNAINNFPALYQSTPVIPSRLQSTPVLETIWRRRRRCRLVATYNALLDQIVHDCTELRLTGVKMRSPRRRSFVQVQAAIHFNHHGAHS